MLIIPAARVNLYAILLLISATLSLLSGAVTSAFDREKICSSTTANRRSGDNNCKMQTTTSVAKRAWGKVERLSSAATSTSFDIYRVFMDDDGTYPNNPRYPALVYKSAFSGSQADGVRKITEGGQWSLPWAWGIFTYHHFHSKAWELLLCVRGEASVQIGGDTGPIVTISKGDLALIPAGLAHKQLDASGGFTLLGAYPTEGFDGSIDTLTGPPTNTERENIANCFVPVCDPIFGLDISKMCE